MKTMARVTDSTTVGEQKARSSTFKEAVRKVAVVGAALAATASVSGCVPFYGQVGMVGGYTDGQIVYSETNPYSYPNGGWYYNYGGVLPYYNPGAIPGYGYSYDYTVPNYSYTVPDYDYGGRILNYGYRAPDYDYDRGYGDMPYRYYGDRDGGRIWMGHRR
jgi:hypothetical protein